MLKIEVFLWVTVNWIGASLQTAISTGIDDMLTQVWKTIHKEYISYISKYT